MMREGEAEKQVIYVIEGIILLTTLLNLLMAFTESFFLSHVVLLTFYASLLSTKAYITLLRRSSTLPLYGLLVI